MRRRDALTSEASLGVDPQPFGLLERGVCMDPPGIQSLTVRRIFIGSSGKKKPSSLEASIALVVDCFSRHCTEYLAAKSSANSVSSTEAHGERILFHRHDSSISSAGSSTSISSSLYAHV